MLSRFESFLDQNFPNWKSLSDDVLNQILDDFVGSIHLRIRHRRCTIYGVPQISRNPKHEYWWSNGHLVSIASYLKREWAVQSNHPSGPYVYIKTDENSLYPIDLVHHIEEETDEEIQERQQLEKKERWDALISVSKQITVLGRKHGYVKDLNFKNELSKKVEKLARRMIGITLNS
ncbi:hypothetical protein CRE_08607 [Caenorhabditis remanei]|uniref:Uncharacterized protein n=1 Tax=Caenorhabditis remanei TaxID=31234 RepID=E3NJI1_CAERE|nr:hypothetical protein CRE_08607 [Caenorhabditis remanei]